MAKIYTSLGLMSGTSLDGVDVSIIRSDGNREFSSILDRYFEYDKELIQKIINIREKITNSDRLNKFSVDLIGFHGQTIFHDPEKKNF